ncbi:hypothetical protein CFOL_v3_29773 [Cephalotus follicularis]|uniref:Ribosomal protein S1 n=1 Tax=Cephalotus follicularis TaxID=3775 RepID=A0A1Q3D1M4_CEPFO|nr:hypothetical protein CFOL_v3_29773 [Cephalotus follicularis]
MSIYMRKLFPRSNSSFMLSSGNALQSSVVRLSEETFLVDAGVGTPRICTQDELTGVSPAKTHVGPTRLENKVGLGRLTGGSGGASEVRGQILARIFSDLVAGDSVTKERAAARFSDSVGSTDVVPGEPVLLLPRQLRQNRVWMELNKSWRANTKVKGFVIEKIRGGYLVAVGGFIAFRPFRRQRIFNGRFAIESISPKRNTIVLI